MQVDQHPVPLPSGDALRRQHHVGGHAVDGLGVDAHRINFPHAIGAIGVDPVVVGAAGGDGADARRMPTLFEHLLELPLRFG